MVIDSNIIVSMTDANQNFSKVKRVVDQYGRAVIFKNNVPCYVVLKFSVADEIEAASNEGIPTSSARLMDRVEEALNGDGQ